jgi:vacuolar-type H+-ATPase subunit H
MHQAPEHPDFSKTIKEIKDAEEEYDRLINSAREKADKTVRDAREKAVEERMKAEEEMVARKNERLRRGTKEIEAQVQKLIDGAKDEGAKLSKKKPEPPLVPKLVNDFLVSL